jgi:hypothetical protein
MVRRAGYRSIFFCLLLLTACSAEQDAGSNRGRGAAGQSGSAGQAGQAGQLGTSGNGGASGAFGNAGTLSPTLDAGDISSQLDAGAANDAAGGGCSDLGSEPLPATTETCGNGLDDDHNGFIDEGCVCTGGATQPCFGGLISKADAAECQKGTQTCVGDEFAGWGKCEGWSCGPTTPPPELCDNQIDDDCDGEVDEGCVLDVPVNIDGDCVSVSCPPQAPYPVGCELVMEGGDSRGCVANTLGMSTVYFQEGDQCPILPFDTSAGHIMGTLLCSTQMPSSALDAATCPINKAEPIHATSAAGCPTP